MVKLGSTPPAKPMPDTPRAADKTEKKSGKSTFTISESAPRKNNADRKNKGKP